MVPNSPHRVSGMPPVTIQLGGQQFVVGNEGLRLSEFVVITADMLPTFGGATVRPLDELHSDVALVFAGAPRFVPLRLPHAEAHRGAAEFGAALVRYAPPGTPPVFATQMQAFVVTRSLPESRWCPKCKGDAYEEIEAPKFWAGQQRECTSCGTQYKLPLPLWKGAVLGIGDFFPF